jgi:hypothetical protein
VLPTSERARPFRFGPYAILYHRSRKVPDKAVDWVVTHFDSKSAAISDTSHTLSLITAAIAGVTRKVC